MDRRPAIRRCSRARTGPGGAAPGWAGAWTTTCGRLRTTAAGTTGGTGRPALTTTRQRGDSFGHMQGAQIQHVSHLGFKHSSGGSDAKLFQGFCS